MGTGRRLGQASEVIFARFLVQKISLVVERKNCVNMVLVLVCLISVCFGNLDTRASSRHFQCVVQPPEGNSAAVKPGKADQFIFTCRAADHVVANGKTLQAKDSAGSCCERKILSRGKVSKEFFAFSPTYCS